MTETDGRALAIASKLHDELKEIQEGLELQLLAAEAAGDDQRVTQVHVTRSHLQSAQALVENLGSLLTEAQDE